MAVQRIQIANNKKQTSVKHQKVAVAKLIGENKDEKARIKVEHIIRDDFMIEANEVLELLCELVHERVRQVTTCKECPVELRSAVASLIWASVNSEIEELQQVKKQLTLKFGTEFAKDALENKDGIVNERLFNKLSYKPPSRKLVNGYMQEIALAYNVEWVAPLEGPGKLITFLILVITYPVVYIFAAVLINVHITRLLMMYRYHFSLLLISDLQKRQRRSWTPTLPLALPAEIPSVWPQALD
jgi:hypothetical protein